MSYFSKYIEYVGAAMDAAGVVVMVVGIGYATFLALVESAPKGEGYTIYRQRIGRSILLGLELLVAGDIIRTVAVAPTLLNVTVLAVIVVIRTFLSFSLELELNGRWPWQREK